MTFEVFAELPIEQQACPVCGKAGFRLKRFLANHVRSHDREPCPDGCGKIVGPQGRGAHRKACPARPDAQEAAAKAERHDAAVGTVRARLRRLLPQTGDDMLARVLKILVDAPKRDGLLIVITDDDGPWLVRPEQVATAVRNSRAVCLVLATERIVLEGLLEDLREGPPSRHEADHRRVG